MRIRRLPNQSIVLISEIDRSERVEYAYRICDGILQHYVVEWDVPSFHQTGSGPHTVQSQIDHWRGVLQSGGILLLGAFDGDRLAGLAIVDPEFEPPMAWLAYLHVSRPYRRRGAGGMLWDEAEAIARSHGAMSIYVSAIPSGPAIDFYVKHGCRPIDEPHPELFAAEPEDIHLVKQL